MGNNCFCRGGGADGEGSNMIPRNVLLPWAEGLFSDLTLAELLSKECGEPWGDLCVTTYVSPNSLVGV